MNEKMPSSMTMKVTRNYSLFKTLEGNREVLSIRKKKIKSSIDTIGYIPSPIIVNEKMEIIDGQGRFEALKELAKPIYYIVVPGLTLEHCIAMNISNTNWTLNDYIKSYAAQGNVNYINLLGLIEKYPMISLRAILTAATNSVNANYNQVKSEKIIIPSNQLLKINEALNWAEQNFLDLKPYCNGRFEVFLCSLIWAYRYSDANKDRLVEVVRQYKNDLPPATNIKYTLEQITKLYNKKLRTGRVYLNVEYEQWCIDNSNAYEERWGISEETRQIIANQKNNTLERAVAP